MRLLSLAAPISERQQDVNSVLIYSRDNDSKSPEFYFGCYISIYCLDLGEIIDKVVAAGLGLDGENFDEESSEFLAVLQLFMKRKKISD